MPNFKQYVLDTIDEFYDAQSREGFTQKKTFSPSQFYSNGKCARRWFFAFNGEDWEDFATARSRRIMQHGTQRHEALQEALESIAHSIEEEIWHEDPPIHAFCDITIDWEEDVIVGEIKTAMSMGYEKRLRMREAPAYQLAQLLIYMYLLDKDKGFFLLENNDTKELGVIQVKMTSARLEWVEYAMQWMRDVYDAYEKNLMPADIFRKNAAICKECPVRKICKSLPREGDIVIEELKLPQ